MARPRVRTDGEAATAQAPEDAALVARIAAGDREALGALYDLHAPVLLGLARRMLGSAAEDLLHDLFLEVWQHAAEYAPGRGTVRAWLIVRARSRALDRLGRSSRESRAAERIASEAPPSAASGAPALIDGAQVRRLLTTLPAELCDVLALAYFEGLSSSEIAARLSVPVGTVKSRTARALGALREALGPPASGGSP
ncbi:MAG TPA: sigma-70 family RNA polymerase sigma factor [Polyangia bacterium]|nr:sigma-70 family RNA polymerase sigma factor [Polyangia bacterium]